MPQVVEPEIETFAQIKVVGVGGAGGAAVNRMVEAGVDNVEFIAVNTDAQALHHSRRLRKFILVKTPPRLGCWGRPELEKKRQKNLKKTLLRRSKGADMVMFNNNPSAGSAGSGVRARRS